MHSLYFPWIRILFFFLIFGSAVYSVRFFDRTPPNLNLLPEDFTQYTELRKQMAESVHYQVNGTNRNFGNLIGLEPHFLPLDFHSPENFQNAIRPLFEKARQEKAIDRKTLVILPEHTGTGLVLLGEERRSVFFAGDFSTAIQALIASHQKEDATPQGNPASDDRPAIPDQVGAIKPADILRKKKDLIAQTYNDTFSRLASEFNVSIVAGSLLLPDPKIERGVLVSGNGSEIYHVSVTYLPNGKAIEPLVKKVYLEDWEKSIATPGKHKQDYIVSVPGWKVGLAIGRDSLANTIYQEIGGTKIDGMVSPASAFLALSPDTWESEDFSLSQARSLGESEIWTRYGLPDKLSITKGKDAVQVFWKGEGWGMDHGVESFTFHDTAGLQKSGGGSTPKVMNLYF